MLGHSFLLGWLALEFILVDCLDLRYSKDRCIRLLPGIEINWVGSGSGLILSIIFSWLNLEFFIIGFNLEHYYDELETLIAENERNKKDEKDEDEE